MCENVLKFRKIKIKMKMKKGRVVNPLQTLWQKIILDRNIFEIAKKYRRQLNLPEGGCTKLGQYKRWLKKNIGDDQEKELQRQKICHQFCDEITRKIPKYFVKEVPLKLVLISFFFNGSADYDRIEKDGAFTMFETIAVIDGKPAFSSKEIIEDGVYIKIGPYSSVDSIKEFVDKKNSLIKSVQEIFLLSKKLPTSIKLYNSPNYERDNWIEFLNSWSKEHLKKFAEKHGYQGTGYGAYKEALIAFIVTKMGDKVTAETVKVALHRRKKQKNKFLGYNSQPS